MHPDKPKSVWTDAHLVSDLNINIVFLDIGSNDLCSMRIAPATLADTIFAFACWLIQQGCNRVMIGEILHRKQGTLYNARVDETNQRLQCLCADQESVRFWQHNFNNFNRRFQQEFVSPDGVHIDPTLGMRRYYRSVRGAVLCAAHSL